jgi:dihydrofolate reductase
VAAYIIRGNYDTGHAAVSARARGAPSSLSNRTSHLATGRPVLAIIAAIAANAVIGAGNRLPWRLPADLKRFRALTSGHAVIMGRKTWESIGRPLQDRQNIVVTRSAGFAAVGAEIATSLVDALARVRLPEPAFCIGGGELYREALPHASLLYLTEIGRAFEGDATFPHVDRGEWREVDREAHADNAAEGLPYAFVTYRRNAC